MQNPKSSPVDGPQQSCAKPSWSERYAQRHQLRRINQFPDGILPPQKVRIYRRGEHFVLQWWDSGAKCTLNSRIEGDLVAAIVQAREIDSRLTHYKSASTSPRRIAHAELVEAFVADLQKRADAGQIDLATARRYESALRHYRCFTEHAPLTAVQRYAAGIDREFQLQFASFLNGLDVTSKGRSKAARRPLKGQTFVLDVVRSMLEWAADPERGNLLPGDFRNPFTQNSRRTQRAPLDPIRPLDITTSMAVDLVLATDRFQLGVF
ncbi:MAG: hypothetical protein L0215_21140, partial [Gemmataceae bacterium]|nr:hypothetical protein [Gemmataceae bacterium]